MRFALTLLVVQSLVIADGAADLAKQPSPWTIEVRPDGTIRAAGIEVTPDELGSALGTRTGEALKIEIDAAPETPYRFVAEVLDLCQKNGLTDVGLKTLAPANDPAPAGPPARRGVRIQVQRAADGTYGFLLGSEWTCGSEARLIELLASLPGKEPVPVTVELEGDDVPYEVASHLLASLADHGFTDVRLAGPARDPESLRVFIGDQTPRWEYRYLRSALAQMQEVELSEHLQSADPDFPQAFWIGHDPLDRYDVIILGDVEIEEDLAQKLRAWVKDGGGLILVAGQQHMPLKLRGTPLETLLPCRLPEARSEWAQPAAPVQLEFTEEGRKMFDGPKTPIPEGKAVWWNSEGTFAYLPLSVSTAGRPLATIQGHPDHVAFAVRTYGKGLVFQSNLDETWRWRNTDPAPHASFWKTVVRLVARRAGK